MAPSPCRKLRSRLRRNPRSQLSRPRFPFQHLSRLQPPCPRVVGWSLLRWPNELPHSAALILVRSEAADQVAESSRLTSRGRKTARPLKRNGLPRRTPRSTPYLISAFLTKLKNSTTCARPSPAV